MNLEEVLIEAKSFDLSEFDFSYNEHLTLSFLKNRTDSLNLNNTMFTDDILREIFPKTEKTEERKQKLENIKKEFYIFLCTDSEVYKDIKAKLKLGFTGLVGLLAVEIAGIVTIPLAIVTAIVTGLLYLVAVMTQNIWCKNNIGLAPEED